LIKVDLHLHTHFSGDSDITFEQISERCQKLGLGAIAITDHGTAKGALELSRQKFTCKLIVGEEVASSEGEIIGLFLNESIPNGLSPEETIRRIHSQGGLACIPHPFDRYRSSAMQVSTLERIVDQIDIIEAFNARTIPFMQNLKLPEKFARQHHIPIGAGSDAHSKMEIGRAYITIPDFNTCDEFKQSILQSTVFGKRPNITVFYRSLLRRLKKKYKRKASAI